MSEFSRRSVMRSFVIEHLSWSGILKQNLKPYQWIELYLMADGFGKIDRAFAESQSWDWSHVRDSSEQAFHLMYEYLMIRVYKGEGWVVQKLEDYLLESNRVYHAEQIGVS